MEFDDQIATIFPFIGELSSDSRQQVLNASSKVHLPTGHPVSRPGEKCEQIAFLLEGEVRVHKTSPQGRDLTLYRIFPGQTCVLTAMSMLADQPFPAHVHVTHDADALLVPRKAFVAMFDSEPAWRQFVFHTMSDRLSDLLELIDDVIFTDLPARLANALVTQCEDGTVALTHEQLAQEIGSSREVVSRVLKNWERQGIVTLSRGQISVESMEKLQAMLVG